MEVTLTKDNFEKEVTASIIPVLVDFWAPWCGPCRMIAPDISAIAKEYDGKIKVCKLNVDDCSDIATRYTIMSIPSLLIFKNGKVMDKRVGAMGKQEIEKFIHNYLV